MRSMLDVEEGVRAEQHGIGALVHGLGEGAVELLDATHERDGKRLDAESTRSLLHHLREQGPTTEGRVLDRRHSTNGRDGGLQHIHPLRVQLSLYVRDAREISAGARQALHQTGPQGVTRDEYDGGLGRGAPGGACRRASFRHDHVQLEAGQLGGQPGECVCPVLRISPVN
jgi:hypothetical protein